MEDIKFETIKKVTDTKFKFRDLKNIEKLESNSPPSIFIGSKLKYPLVNVGILSPLERQENAWMYDSEKYWSENNFQVGEVVQLRSGLMNSRFQTKVKDVRAPNNKFIEMAKEIAMSSKQVDVEIELKNRLSLKQRDRVVTPHGMRASLKQARITSNVKIPQKIDKVANDELKASEAMKYLYKNEYEDFYGRKTYASNTVGGYYASRLPILEFLEKEKRQASVLAIRLETPSYWAALGVFVVRESTRKTMATKGVKFSDKNELFNSAKQIGNVKFGFDCSGILERSKLLNNIQTQKRLGEWL